MSDSIAVPEAAAVPPPERFNFARHVFERNARRAARPAYVDDAGALSNRLPSQVP